LFIGNFKGGRGSQKPKFLTESIKLIVEFPEGWGGGTNYKKTHPWERNG